MKFRCVSRMLMCLSVIDTGRRQRLMTCLNNSTFEYIRRLSYSVVGGHAGYYITITIIILFFCLSLIDAFPSKSVTFVHMYVKQTGTGPLKRAKKLMLYFLPLKTRYGNSTHIFFGFNTRDLKSSICLIQAVGMYVHITIGCYGRLSNI